MARAIFLCDVNGKIEYVYDNAAMEEIEALAELDRTVYTREDIVNGQGEFRDVHFIFSTWGMPVFSEEEIGMYFPELECVFYAAGSVQFFARPFLNRGVKVFSGWGANAIPVAEYASAQIILANKGFYQSSRIHSKEDYTRMLSLFPKYKGNYNTKIGILGAGRVGKLVIERLKTLNVEILVYDPFLSDNMAVYLGVEKFSLDKIFSQCTVISNHMADKEETRGILNKALFEMMPPYATFINTGRGAQVAEQDLCDVLSSRSDLTAILDVTFPEPPEADSGLYKLDNCILTPHIAGSFGNEVNRMAMYMADQLQAHIKGEPCDFEVTLKMLETMA